MKYNVENQLDLFEFHDSKFTLVSFDNDELIVSVKHLNIHKNSIHNPSDYDMEIKDAIITFKGFHITYYKAHSFLNKISTYYEQKAIEKFKKEFKEKHTNHINIFYLGMIDDSLCHIDADGKSPFFSIEFTYDNVTIEWNEYLKKAWYELYKKYNQELTLITPNGEESIIADIGCHYEDPCYDPIFINVVIKYNGKELYGHSKLLHDALLDIQKQLPEGVTLKTDCIK